MPADFESGPVLERPQAGTAILAELPSPAMLRVTLAAQIAETAALGFDYVLLTGPDLLEAAGPAGHPVILEIDLNEVPEGEHPEWVVHGPDGPGLRFLGETDETVDWWDARIARWQRAGVAGFYARSAHLVPAAVWRRLIAAAEERRPETIFVAEFFGATPAQASELTGAGFGFAVSSSCFWDFSAGWLNADTARVAQVGAPLALAAPRGAAWGEAAARRALRFAAGFAPGWVMEAGFCKGAGFDLSDEVRALNALRREHAALSSGQAGRLASSPWNSVAVVARGRFVTVANAALNEAVSQAAAAFLPGLGVSELLPVGGEAGAVTPAEMLTLAPGEARFFETGQAEPILLAAPKLDVNAPRVAIEAITPQVDDGKFPVRRVVGELVAVEADLLADGHDKLAGEVLIRAADEKVFRAFPLALLNNDRWRAQVPLERLGRHYVVVVAWKDRWASFADEVMKKHAAGVATQLELREGLALVEEAVRKDKKLRTLVARLREMTGEDLREALLSENMAAVMREALPRKFLTRSHEICLDAERLRAGFASWYEIFPRSAAGDGKTHGTFIDVIAQLPRIAAMGFDVLYFPPIHPIGTKNRKGRNNTLTPAADDPGSPYAIGSAEGGHDAIHPELGTLEDFRRLVAAAQTFGIEIALDFAIQCAPDHPWLKEHKDWFDWRPDGSIKYAENPPKKYEDIVNVDFYAEGARPGLWHALRDVVAFWCEQGVRIFRVDNPHTKPFPFWEWMIADIRSRHPDAVFLAEAFTRPKIMARLAKIGFSQSYSYFTWRNTKAELTEYLTELSTLDVREYFRPNFFVNTPDINPVFLQNSGRAGHLIRAVLAATLSGLWGVYNGFELCEATPIPGREEYFNSEKYEIRSWDYDRPGNIVAEITALNRIRRENAALQSHVNVEFLPCSNERVLFYRKFAADGNVLLVAVSLDPYSVQEASIELPLWRFGLPDDGALAAEDLMRGFSFTWRGKWQPVLLNPAELPFCIWRVKA